MTLHIECDLRQTLGPVRDQGRRPTCLAFAASAAHEQARDAQRPLSPEWLYYHAAKRAGTGPRDGTTLPDTRHVLHQVGQPEETVWPYRGQVPDQQNWTPPTPGFPLFQCGSDKCAAEAGRIRALLDEGLPVVLALFVSSAFTTSAGWLRVATEILLPDDREPIDRGRGHAVVAVGYGRYGDDGVILLRNSWGPAWGAEGHAWVRETYLTRRLLGGFSISEGDGDVLQSDAGDRFARTRVG